MLNSYWLTEAGGDLTGDRNSEVKTASAYSPIMLSNSAETSARASESNSSAKLWDNTHEININNILVMTHKPVFRDLFIISLT